MQFCFKIKAFSNDNKKIHTAILWWSHPSSQGLWLPSETLLISWIASDYLGKPSDQGWAAYFSSPAFPLKGSGGKNVLVGQVLSVGLLAPLKGLAVWRKPGQASGFSDCPAWLVCCVRGAFGGTQWSAVKDYSRRGRWLLDPVHFEDTPEEKLSNLCRVFCRTQLTLPRYTHTHTHIHWLRNHFQTWSEAHGDAGMQAADLPADQDYGLQYVFWKVPQHCQVKSKKKKKKLT